MTPCGATSQRSPLRSMGSLGSQSSWPDQSPSERYFRGNSFNCPPTPSPVAFPHLKTGWTGVLNDAGFVAQGATGVGGAFFQQIGQTQSQSAQPVQAVQPSLPGQQQMYWVQMPVMMQPSGTQLPMQAAQPVQLGAASLPVGALQAAVPVPWVASNRVPLVQGEVVQDQAPQNVARGVPEASESQSISSAGRQLLDEALNGPHFDAISQNVGQPISGTVAGPVQTPGSALHGTGNCNPCAWFWKARGCACGVECDYCHVCPEGELKRRKKLKIAEIKSGAREPAHPRT